MANEIMSFEEIEKAMAKRKTFFVGGLKGCGIDVYTKRDGSGTRVLRVKWYVPNPNNPDHDPYLALGIERSQLFAFSAKGLAAAVHFIEFIDPAARWVALRAQL